MWVRLDDNLLDHPKMIAIGLQGRALWLASLCYANKQTTDGFIADYLVKDLARRAGVTRVKETVAKLTATHKGTRSPVWHRVEGGYQIHDYADFQFTAEQVEELRQKRSDAGKLGGVRSGESRRSKTKQTRSKSEANANPVPESRTKKNFPRNAEGVTAPQGAGPAAHVVLEEKDPFDQAERFNQAEYVVDDAWYQKRQNEQVRPPPAEAQVPEAPTPSPSPASQERGVSRTYPIPLSCVNGGGG